MADEYRYVVFEVDGGWFGLFGTENAVFRSCLRVSGRRRCERILLAGVEQAEFDAGYFRDVQDRIAGYYEGMAVDFSDVGVDISGRGDFTRRILTACRKISYGETMTYGQVAAKAGNPKSARAAGTALASNPIPLIIPCHRIICANGNCGGFSGYGGKKTKQKMLDSEQK